ncbi:SMP-30/gluconolactonase/LRE family protein [Stakelama flava]|uniref:SMP-30/gluconolactonase/LRE family protein n=1 Tax=Stakelama flava TaxID=2860338 RepID=UPI0031BA3DFC
MGSEPHLVLAVGATLGEGPVWVPRDNALWFVDIKSRHVHRFDPASGDAKRWDAPGEIGWVLPASDGGFVAGVADGLYRFEPEGEGFAKLRDAEPHLPDNRLNDAATDRQGRIWFGSMDNGEELRTGKLYRFEDGIVVDSGLAPVTITNGPAIAPDGGTLYAVDTMGKQIHAHTIAHDGTLSDGRCFIAFDDSVKGNPDGAICDSQGGVWVAFYGGWAVRRYDSSGTLTHQIDFPVANITKIALGGEDGCDAYATTARKGLNDAELAQQPLAGHLFHFRVDIPGIPVTSANVKP